MVNCFARKIVKLSQKEMLVVNRKELIVSGMSNAGVFRYFKTNPEIKKTGLPAMRQSKHRRWHLDNVFVKNTGAQHEL